MSIRRNIIHLLFFQVLTWIASFLFLIVGPRRLGAEAVGALGYSIAYVGFFTLIAGLGTSTLFVRDISRNHALISQYIFNATIQKAVIVVAVSAIGIPFAYLIGNRGDRFVLIVLGFVAMAFACMAEIAIGSLNGMEVISKPAFLGVIQIYVSNGLGVVAILLGYGIIAYAVLVTIAAFIPFVASYVMVRRYVHRPFHLDRRLQRYLVRAGIPLMTLVVFNTIYGTIDVPILGGLTNDTTVGWYTVAYRWVGIPIFITTAVVSSYFPRFSAHGSPMTRDYARYVNQAVRIVMLAAVPSSLGLAMVADDLVHLVYQPDFYPAIPLIRILALHIPLAGIDTVLASALIAANQQRRYLYVALTAAVLNPIMCVILIRSAEQRYGNGAIGAAVVTVATEVYIMLGAGRLRAPGVVDRASFIGLTRIVSAGLAMVVLLFAVDTFPLLAQVGFGAAVYLVALVVFRAVTMDEVRRLAGSLPLGRRRRLTDPIE